MALSANEQRALHKAIALNGAALVRRLEHGIYEVPSNTREGTTYIVCGVQMDASDHTCTCEAGSRGLKCWHVESVRLRRVQETAMAQARKLQRATAAAPAPAPAVAPAPAETPAAPSPALVEFLFVGGPLDALADLPAAA